MSAEFKWKRYWRYALGVLLLLAILVGAFALVAPADSGASEPISIAPGSGLGEISVALESAGALHSSALFKLVVKLRGASSRLQAGDYIFERPLSPWSLASRLMDGIYSANPVKVTVPEGLNMREVANVLERNLPRFSTERFLRIAEASEGELMPDTYFFSPLIDEVWAAKMMQDNFARQIEPLAPEIQASGRSLNQIIVMASLLEEEAATPTDKGIIAGILWKRLDDGMLLQVDAIFPYLIGKNSFNLTRDDLKIDSPYNTYKYKGLPPGPITNPGLESIEAALRPEVSPYWFYLSDRHGNMHYARTYEEHKQNSATYLD